MARARQGAGAARTPKRAKTLESCRDILEGSYLAGGTGSRLTPLTRVVNKHHLPVFGKPMIYYPLTTMMLGGIREAIIVTSAKSVEQFETLLGDTSQWGLKLSYRVQRRPTGIVDGL